MAITRDFLCKIRESEREHIRQAITLSAHFAEVRKAVAAAGGDWASLKAVLKAEILDEEGGDHLARALGHDGDRTAYADLLGLTPRKMNNENFSSDRALSLEAGSAGHTPMRAGRDDNAASKEETNDESAVSSSGATPVAVEALHLKRSAGVASNSNSAPSTASPTQEAGAEAAPEKHPALNPDGAASQIPAPNTSIITPTAPISTNTEPPSVSSDDLNNIPGFLDRRGEIRALH